MQKRGRKRRLQKRVVDLLPPRRETRKRPELDSALSIAPLTWEVMTDRPRLGCVLCGEGGEEAAYTMDVAFSLPRNLRKVQGGGATVRELHLLLCPEHLDALVRHTPTEIYEIVVDKVWRGGPVGGVYRRCMQRWRRSRKGE